MKNLFEKANRYVETSDWKTIAVLKFCLLSLGLLAGMQIPKKHRRFISFCAAFVFLATYLPLMAKLYRVFTERE